LKAFVFNMAGDKEIFKPSSAKLENSMDEKYIEPGNEGDYSGAVAKTSAEEIKLVRKLDLRIMSILWAMYFLVSKRLRSYRANIL
jgi:hypothetical protein